MNARRMTQTELFQNYQICQKNEAKARAEAFKREPLNEERRKHLWPVLFVDFMNHDMAQYGRVKVNQDHTVTPYLVGA